ncbi:TPA: group II intron maturase-specific domain-containing protein [Escherichia coli]|uniref:group II intron maturase-specific domain-containing protein n=1 Tax=Escherichia coli TaxID=562 RepID=UPI0021BF8F0E|nr:group II intron maturase-specific domain-containing protein [Escherichia coli]
MKTAPVSEIRLKEKIRSLTTENRSKSVKVTGNALTPVSRGWISYFRLMEVRGMLEKRDGWIKQKLRCLLRRHWKRPRTWKEQD